MNVNSVDSLVTEIQGLSGSSQDLAHLNNRLKQSEDVIRSQAATFATCLTRIDPSIHSLGYLYILEACTAGAVPEAQANELIISVVRFIDVCSVEQIRLVPDKFISVCKRLHEQVMKLGAPMRAVGPLLTAIRKIQTSPEHLTPLHPDFLQVCLSAKCYKVGYGVLEDDICEVDQPRDFFLYCYYGGMICIGQKRYAKALELFHNVVTAPMSTMNAIAVEAYKKYILVSLIHLRQFSTSFPKYTSSVAQRNLKNFSQPYIELANSYSTGNISELKAFVEANQEKFENGNNLGLVKQVVSSMYKRNIQRLTQTYLTLSLQDIANTAEISTPKEAEMHVLQMIEDGEIYAAINQKDGMVRFLEDPEQYKTCEMIERIDSSIQRIMKLSKKLTTMDESMSCDPLYLSKVRERQRYDLHDFDDVPQRFNL
ncbi:putative proteasome component (PCI) domain, winged helix DNA-binding domain superfamily [Helianthus annuus]|nr:putative proteasome component (PCI) domain, winged helix DNA-binding domain superfamily [Helianthus annuus]KAJ0557987.1 putative proteasome component (PCI) domain, winged helix DNA-binding domain superfamily [Helianthus annuus]KAJ0564019.1 putative proteasome component (PCI) domain, winged helix DNA-binding domain superfamily [Helianthus annuus]KAJ0729355.1 putative proteasome component (PCI) domain, winged helix DNA-binding domain superfamily [Helianthus annuus]KAJ0905703.1 putative proteas